MASTDRVVLSVVLRVVGGKLFVRRCLSSLKDQIGNLAIEVIVPHDANDSDVSRLKCEFPQFVFLNVSGLQTSLPVATPADGT